MTMSKPKSVPFNREGISKLPNDKPIVYQIKNVFDENIFTGVARCGQIQERLEDHLKGGSNHILGGEKVLVTQAATIKDAKELEARIIARDKPVQNQKQFENPIPAQSNMKPSADWKPFASQFKLLADF